MARLKRKGEGYRFIDKKGEFVFGDREFRVDEKFGEDGLMKLKSGKYMDREGNFFTEEEVLRQKDILIKPDDIKKFINDVESDSQKEGDGNRTK